MGEGTTPLLEGLAWVTSLCVIYLFFSKIKKKVAQRLVLKLVHQKEKKKGKKRKEKRKKRSFLGKEN